MAQLDVKSGLIADSAKVLEDSRDQLQAAIDPSQPKDELEGLREWIISRVRMWRDHRRSNYETLWDQYERLWRGMWASEDKSRKSERSTLVTPGLSEAVENIVAEVEEAVWGRGDSFDLKAPFGADENAAAVIDDNKAKLKDDLGRGEFNTNVGEALINAAVYGTGIGEILVETFTKREIAASVAAMDPSVPPQAQVIEKECAFATLQSVNPRNFLIEPTARTVDKALGVAIEEYVGSHIINAGMRDGKYRRVRVGTSSGDPQLGADRQAENEYAFDKVHIIRYYGLVPKHLLLPPESTVDLLSSEGESVGNALGEALRQAEGAAEAAQDVPGAPEDAKEELVDLSADLGAPSGQKSEDPVDSEMIEAVVFIANESVCIKAIENPYLMKDRPVVAFPWDVVPGRFQGRGVCEKGLVPQKVMDAELRARIDALAYISAPMMAMDASRLPRGFQLTVRPGKSILTNGDPNTVLRPMHFGQLEQSTFAHSQQLDQMIQRATGSLDVMTMASRGGGDARPGAVSMMLSGIVKRHKRTLMGFVDRFYVPALRKVLWRNMQYYPERYTPRNWDFVASSTMGIIQREYESQNLVSLMSTMDPGTPEHKMLLMGVVANTGLTHRREIIDMLKQSIGAAQQAASTQAQIGADPQTIALQAQLAQTQLQVQIAESQAKIRELNSRANLQDIKAMNAQMEPGFRRAELATKALYEVPAEQQDRAIQNRLQMFDRVLKARDIASNERITAMQTRASVASETVKARGQVAAAHAKGRADVATTHTKGRADVAAHHVKGVADVAATHVKGLADLAAARASNQAPAIQARSPQLLA